MHRRTKVGSVHSNGSRDGIHSDSRRELGRGSLHRKLDRHSVVITKRIVDTIKRKGENSFTNTFTHSLFPTFIHSVLLNNSNIITNEPFILFFSSFLLLVIISFFLSYHHHLLLLPLSPAEHTIRAMRASWQSVCGWYGNTDSTS